MTNLIDDNLLNELRNRMTSTIDPCEEVERLRSQLEHVNNKLQEAEKVQSHFLSNIRCEINNPLTAIMGHCAYLRGLSEMNLDRVHDVALTIFNEAFELDFQMQNIIAAAEFEAGDRNLFISRVDIHFVLDMLIETFQPRLLSKQLSLTLQNTIPKSRFFSTDANCLHLVMSNILNNAIEYSPEKTKLEVIASVDDQALYLTVHDHGIGIEPSMLHTIFDRFRQLDQGAQRQHKGHGLGLSVCRAALDLLDGRIDVQSQPEQGSTFSIVIPETSTPIEAGDIAPDANTIIFESSLNEAKQ
ncbi:HAMP domain-containing histidine kinase [candidate division KSB1 bacterium]|nr:HAMP domain-containing histidine kinase [candidate division KSB1 bacterium]